jgi:hypothetical protein
MSWGEEIGIPSGHLAEFHPTTALASSSPPPPPLKWANEYRADDRLNYSRAARISRAPYQTSGVSVCVSVCVMMCVAQLNFTPPNNRRFLALSYREPQEGISPAGPPADRSLVLPSVNGGLPCATTTQRDP